MFKLMKYINAIRNLFQCDYRFANILVRSLSYSPKTIFIFILVVVHELNRPQWLQENIKRSLLKNFS